MKKKLQYRVILQPAEEGGCTVFAPALPGCISEGDTQKDALSNIQEAIQGWIAVSRTYGDYIPPAMTLNVPNHRTVKKGTLANILRQANIPLEDFLEAN